MEMNRLCFSFVICVTALIATSWAEDLPQDVPDIFEAFRFFEYAPAVRDVNRYPVFQCLTATRTSYKPEIPMVTYDWSLNGGEGQERKHLFVTYTPASTIDTAFYTLEFDGEVIKNNKNPARLLYLNDDEGCSILQISVFGYQCILWVSDDRKDNISQECLAEYDKVCGTGFSIYDKKTCNDTAP
ncbi:uncharacterized protein LOC144152201 [Haemaphysalis longicornis]